MYQILFADAASTARYERLFRQLFHFKRVLYSVRRCQRQIIYFQRLFKRKRRSKLSKTIGSILNSLHFLFFHMFGFVSRMFQHFGSQIESHWSAVFAHEFGTTNEHLDQQAQSLPEQQQTSQRKHSNIEQFLRAHERFISSVETIVFFDHDHSLIAAFSAVNDAILDFCETFAETELFPTMETVLLRPRSSSANLEDEEGDFEVLQAVAEQLFRHQFKIGIAISKYRACISHFITLSQATSFAYKFDVLNYQPCLDAMFACHNARSKSFS